MNCLGKSGEQGTKVASWLLEITGPVKVRIFFSVCGNLRQETVVEELDE